METPNVNVVMKVIYDTFNIFSNIITFECNFYHDNLLDNLYNFSSKTTNIGIIICFPYIIKYLSLILKCQESSKILYNASCLVIYKNNYFIAVIINKNKKNQKNSHNEDYKHSNISTSQFLQTINNQSYYISAKVTGLQDIIFQL